MLRNALNLGIRDTAFALGGEAREIADLADRRHIGDDLLCTLTDKGARWFFIEARQSCRELSARTVKEVLAKSAIDPAAVDMLVFTSTVFETTSLYPDQIARLVATDAGCINAKAFSLHHAYCVSPFLAIKLLLEILPRVNKPDPVAVVVCADAISDLMMHLRPIGEMGVHSDGAAAVLLAAQGPRSVIRSLDVVMSSNAGQEFEGDRRIAPNPFFFAKLYKVLKQTVDHLPDADRGTLSLCANNLSRAEWQKVAAKLGIPEGNILCQPGIGHVFGADPFINFAARPADNGPLSILAATAAGSAYATALLEDV